MSAHPDSIVHLVGGACGGTMGAIVTCPLEVIKTRLQSSTFRNMMNAYPPPSAKSMSNKSSKWPNKHNSRQVCTSAASRSQVVHLSQFPSGGSPRSLSLYYCFRHIIEVEGPRALWKGLIPNLVGVAPSRAIYFCAYSQSKKIITAKTSLTEGPKCHIVSATIAGFSACTLTNPIWFIKTRLQLDNNILGARLSAWTCIKQIYQDKGIPGFYKGLTASYYGISETVIHLVIYEALKAKLRERREAHPDRKSLIDFLEFMLAGACSKTIASIGCYPHEVARTRLREEGQKYTTFWQTLGLVLKEEGWAGLYRGLTTQLVRQIPNTAIMMATYEGVVYLLTKVSKENDFYEDVDE